MRPLSELSVRLVLPSPEVEQRVIASATELVGLVEEFSSLGTTVPWSVLRFRTTATRSYGVYEVTESAAEALGGVLSADGRPEPIGRELRDQGCLIAQDTIGFGRDDHFRRLTVAVTAEIEGPKRERFYERLCELLRPRHDGSHIPMYRARLGFQESILEKALQRDYAWGGHLSAGDPELRLAKALASMLPKLSFTMTDPRGLPNRLGWLNYWQPEVAEELGFPDPVKDARILPLCHRTESGAWIVKLTEDSLDLTRPDHIEAIVWAYWRFDKIGKRRPLATKKAQPRAKRAPVAEPEGTKDYVIRERDQSGQWHKSDYKPVRATSADEALRVHFAKMMRSRAPKPGESLRKLQDAYDEMAGTIGMTRSVDVDAVEAAQQDAPTTAKPQTPGTSPMPSHAEREIASTALQLWDMYAEESDGREQLLERVTEGLVDAGLDTERAQTVALMADAALNGKDNDPATGEDFKTDPIYVALREEIEGGGWGV